MSHWLPWPFSFSFIHFTTKVSPNTSRNLLFSQMYMFPPYFKKAILFDVNLCSKKHGENPINKDPRAIHIFLCFEKKLLN